MKQVNRFKLRKHKASRNLVSYGVVLGTLFLSLAQGNLVRAEEQASGSELDTSLLATDSSLGSGISQESAETAVEEGILETSAEATLPETSETEAQAQDRLSQILDATQENQDAELAAEDEGFTSFRSLARASTNQDEDNQAGVEPVTVTTEERTVTQTIRFVGHDSPGETKIIAPDVVRTLDFSRTVTTDNVTGEVTYGEWVPKTTSYFTEYPVPQTIGDYTTFWKETYEMDVWPESIESGENFVIRIDYKAPDFVYGDYYDVVGWTYVKDITRTIRYVDEEGNELAPAAKQVVSYYQEFRMTLFGPLIDIKWTTEDPNFSEMTSPELDLYETTTITVPAVTTTHRSQNIEEVVVYRPKKISEVESKVTSLRINYHGASTQTPPSHTEAVEWTRTVTKNAVTGEVIEAGPWVAAKPIYEPVVSPELTNYTVDKAVVSDQEVQETDITVDVYYSPKMEETSESKTITRTITYVDEADKELKSPVTQTVTFTRTVTTNLVTGEQTFGEWTSDNAELALVASPEIAKYTTATKEVAAQTVTPDQEDLAVKVVYTPTFTESTEEKTITRTITYVDENGKELAPAVTQTVTFTRTVTTNDVTGEQTFGEWTSDNAELALVVSPEIAKYTTATKEVAAQTVTPDQEDLAVKVVYTPTFTESTEEKTITRTIKYVDENGKELAPAVTQTVTFTRTVTTNDVTGEQTFGEWTSTNPEFPAVKSPLVDQYTTDKALVAAVTADAETKDIEEVVVYRKLLQVPNQSTKPNRPSKPVQPVVEQPADDAGVETTKPGTQKVVASRPAAQSLPKTGDAGQTVSLLGMAIMGALGALGLAKKSRKED